MAGVALCAALATAPSPSTAAEAHSDNLILTDGPNANQPELMLLSVRLGEIGLGEALSCYADDRGTLLPLGALCSLLELAIRVDTSRGVAEGFFLTENRRFELDLRSRQVRIQGNSAAFDTSRVRLEGADIYVDAALISRWLPVDLIVDPLTAALRVLPREPLPLQERLRRQARIAQNLGTNREHYPTRPDPYQALDVPFLDQLFTFSVPPASDGKRSPRFNHTTLATGDFLYTEASAYVAGASNASISEFRFTAARRDPEAGLLGALHAREVAAGEVSFPGQDLIARAATGTGFVVSNLPAHHPNQFDSHTFQGQILPGWEIELYRNGALIGYQQAGPDGRYLFENMPLLFGANTFQLIFYGPQGQRRTETEVFDVSPDLVPAGLSYYELAASDIGGAHSRALLSVSRGLTGALSGSAGVSSVRFNSVTRTYGTLTGRIFLGRMVTSLDYALGQGGGNLARGSAQARVGPFSLLARQARLHDFQSEVFGRTTGDRRISLLRVDAAPQLGPLPRVPVTLELDVDRIGRDQELRNWSGRASIATHGTWTSLLHNWSQNTLAGRPQPRQSYGSLLVSQRLHGFGLRGEVDYNAAPASEITATSLTAEVPLGEAAQLDVGAAQWKSTAETRYTVGFNQGEGSVGFGVLAGWSAKYGASGNLSLTVGLDREPRRGRWYSHARGVATGGAASAKVFLDVNGNGRQDAGEPVIPGVRFLVNQTPGPVTESDGVAFVGRLSAGDMTDLAMETQTLEDPQWAPSEPGSRLKPRPGRVVQVDFPVRVLGEVTGTLRRLNGERRVPAEGIDVQLLDSEGAAVRNSRSDYDGFYDFANLAPGEYHLGFDGGQLAELHLKASRDLSYSVLPSGTLLEAQDVLLVPDGPAQPRPLAAAPDTGSAPRATAGTAAEDASTSPESPRVATPLPAFSAGPPAPIRAAAPRAVEHPRSRNRQDRASHRPASAPHVRPRQPGRVAWRDVAGRLWQILIQRLCTAA